MSDLSHDVRSGPSDLASPVSVLEHLARAGYGTALRPGVPAGTLVCAACGITSPMTGFDQVWATRLEGQSDPDDMVLVVAARCPSCGQGGAVVLGFGPAGSAVDAAIVADVPDDAMHRPDPEER